MTKHSIAYIVLWTILAFVSCRVGAESLNDSLLNVLDKEIANRPLYMQKKHSRVDSLLAQWGTPDICYALFKEYSSFRIDSALYYAKQYNNMMDGRCSGDSAFLARMTIAEATKGMGQYDTALGILHSMTPISEKTKRYCYHLNHSIYYSLYYSAINHEDAMQYRDSLILYKKKLISVYSKDKIDYQITSANLLMLEGDPTIALRNLSAYMRSSGIDIKDNPVLSRTMADIYHAIGNEEKEAEYLIRASISDIQKASKKYTALQHLAMLLYNHGDVERAYNYISCALEDITFSNARYRMFEIAEYMPIITAAHNRRVESYNRNRYILIAILVALMGFSCIMAILLHKRNTKLKTAQSALDETNSSLKNLNTQLRESNRIKEEYIGQVFNMCSSYIKQQEALRKNISNKIKSGQINELSKFVNAKVHASDAMKEFFENFDTVFLTLFPNFIESFNNLLLPEEQIIVKEGELLTPELRIYALIRLGINDCTKIASFLHFSPQTVYNYRLRMRNKARVDKDSFAKMVLQL